MEVHCFKNISLIECYRGKNKNIRIVNTSVLAEDITAVLHNNGFPATAKYCYMYFNHDTFTFWYHDVADEFCKCIITV